MASVVSLSALRAEMKLLEKVIESTGLAEEVVTSLVVTADDLDDICDAILEQFSVLFKKVVKFGR